DPSPASVSVSSADVWANVDCQTASETCSLRTPAHAVHRSCASPTSLNASPTGSESTSTSTHCGKLGPTIRGCAPRSAWLLASRYPGTDLLSRASDAAVYGGAGHRSTLSTGHLTGYKSPVQPSVWASRLSRGKTRLLA